MAGEPVTPASSPDRPGWARRALPWVLRLLVPALFGLWLWKFADLAALGRAFASLAPGALVLAAGLALVNIVIGGVRWRVLMHSFGARDLPGVLVIIRVFFVGLFYNTFVPGSVGGDVVRGVVSRQRFQGRATSFVVVLIERLVGLLALCLVFLVGLLGVAGAVRGVDLHQVLWWVAGLAAVGVLALALALAGGWLRKLLGHVPRIRHPLDLVWVFGLSLLGHGASLMIFALLARGLGIQVSLAELLFVVPLALLSAVIPIAIAGMGPREVALVALLRWVGVQTEQGVALSLVYAGIIVATAGVGGVLQLIHGRVGLGAAPPAVKEPQSALQTERSER